MGSAGSRSHHTARLTVAVSVVFSFFIHIGLFWREKQSLVAFEEVVSIVLSLIGLFVAVEHEGAGSPQPPA